MKAHIVTLPGDYIGPEIVAQAVKVLNAVAEKYGHTFCFDERRLGGASIDAFGVPLTDETLAACNAADAVLMGRIDESVVKALMGAQTAVATGALGIVETFSAASAIKAADTAVKTSKVEILDLRVSRGMGGKGVVMLTGEVSDVTAAVEAGGDYAKQQGLFCSSSVMAAPHEELWQYL